jgi:hypothetical protein
MGKHGFPDTKVCYGSAAASPLSGPEPKHALTAARSVIESRPDKPCAGPDRRFWIRSRSVLRDHIDRRF